MGLSGMHFGCLLVGAAIFWAVLKFSPAVKSAVML
jgi:hypothetical protein